MEFWIFVVGFVTIVTLVVLWSVSRTVPRGQVRSPVDSVSSDIEIYKNQLSEIDADLKRGLIDSESADEARLELSRNILSAEKQLSYQSHSRHRTVAMRVLLTLGIFCIPVIAIGIYVFVGDPEVKSHPFSELMDADPKQLTPSETLVRTEALFARNPDNGKLADELSSAYLVSGRFQDAVNTYIEAIRLNGESAPRLVGYGMALTGFNDGTINDDARQSFEKAIRLEPEDFYPRMFLAEALNQAGNPSEAIQTLQEFLDRSPRNNPWRERAEDMIMQLKLTKAIKQTGGMSEDGTISPEMIGTMVEGLATQLKSRPDDLEGWKLLIRSWLVLKNTDKAKAALEEGQSRLPQDKAAELLDYGRSEGLVLEHNTGENRQ